MKLSLLPVKYLLIALVLLGLVGCSTKMSYRFLDWAIAWELDDYVELDKSQQQAFDKVLDEFIVWHQKEELPRYVAQLDNLKAQMQSDTLTPKLWADHMDYAQAHWYRLFEHVFDGILPIIQSLSDKQVDALIAQLKEDEVEDSKEYLGKSQAELLKESNKRQQKRAEKWLGKLTDKQKAMINSSNESRLATLDMWLEYRHEWLRQFEQALRQRADTAVFSERMRVLMTAPQTLRSEAHQAAIRQNSENFGKLVMDIYRDLSDKQRSKLWREYDSLADDLRELALESTQSASN
ncbi:hypothetical protein KJI95_00145 [Shewanella sp. JM162201]|uniref:Lipoprotein n=1 Tax=Shewanella jiangmenensis TaxID=2837387 RepID=A0ABS5UXX3_9GAMM|nr:DUF6279 family lipoprotein [Shewanella jiangmenensis]MBT1442938.1 hypothetical protein [Shewanella jiangmenensis]